MMVFHRLTQGIVIVLAMLLAYWLWIFNLGGFDSGRGSCPALFSHPTAREVATFDVSVGPTPKRRGGHAQIRASAVRWAVPVVRG